MANLLPITSVRRKHLQDVVRQSLRAGLNIDILDDVLASIDWSGTHQHRPAIADDLGQLEAWNSEYSEGRLTESRYVARLLSVLPPRERNRRLHLHGGKVLITVVRRGVAAQQS